MGRVFKAEHQTMKRVVALKVLAPELLQTERAQELFEREVRVVASLTHPNIVAAYDADRVDGRCFLVLEFVDGPNLEQLVRSRARSRSAWPVTTFPRRPAACSAPIRWGWFIATSSRPTCWCSCRGSNGDAPGLIKISDFGLARLQSPHVNPNMSVGVGTILTRENTVMGTPDFLSPEQARNLHNTDIRSDVYSLGCTFYYLLTGQVPYPGGRRWKS